MVQDYKLGKTSVVSEPELAQVKSLIGREGTSVSTGPGFSWVGISLNCSDEGARKGDPLADRRVRLAIRQAIDAEKMVSTTFGDFGAQAAGVVSPVTPEWYWQIADDERLPFDPQAAQSLLDEAGYADPDGDGVRETPDGAPLSIQLTGSSAYTYEASWMKMAAASLKDVGFDATVQVLEENTKWEKAYAGELDAWGGGFYGTPDPDFVLQAYTTAQIGAFNDAGWSDPEYDELYAQQKRLLDPGQRKPVVDACQKKLYEESPVIPIMYLPAFSAYDTANWTDWLPAPPRTGSVTENYVDAFVLSNVRPATEAVVEDGGLSGGAIAGIVAGAVVVVGAVALLVARGMSRRRRSEEES